MKKGNKKPFIPKDKPKSWILGIISALIALLIIGPILFIGAYLGNEFIKGIGYLLFISCWLVFTVTWLIFIVGLISGKYKNIEEKKWADQLW